MSTDYSNLKSQYPSVISADQFRQICHISKRKAKWLLENNVVPCEDSGKKTRRFSIRIDDAINYLVARDDAPTLVATPPGAFSSGYQHPGAVPRRTPIPPQIFEQYLLKRWRDAPDALTVAQAEKLTGYAATTIGEWIRQERLQAVWYYNHYQIPKTSLIVCLMKLESESRHYYSPQHLEMIQEISM